jgi:hypothetical protein
MAPGYVDPVFLKNIPKKSIYFAKASFELVNPKYQRRSRERISISHKCQKYVKRDIFIGLYPSNELGYPHFLLHFWTYLGYHYNISKN